MRNDFAIFIMVHGRPDKMWTLPTLRKHGYTGKVYFIADDLDDTRYEYIKRYGDDLLVFDKKKAALRCESGDNSGDLRSTLYAANTIPEIAKKKGLNYFMIMCDDYTMFVYNFDEQYRYNKSPTAVHNLDAIIDRMIDYLEKSKAVTIAMTQGGDFIGGSDAGNAKPKILRKAMNTFICRVDNPIKFIGRLNEDVTTYVTCGNRGDLFLSITDVAIKQKATQSEKSGLTDVYVDMGTYVKSFFPVMYNPSCVKVSMMGDKHRRIHHNIIWKNAVPCILRENNKKVN